jgi:hypothetical protein
MKTILLLTLLSIGVPTLAQNTDSFPPVHKASIRGVRDRQEGVTFRLRGIFTHDEVIYYRVEATNRSPLIYDVAAFRCTVRDRKVLKRHTYQEIPLVPLWIRGDTPRLAPGNTVLWTIALRKEVLPRGRYLSIRLLERWGSRNLELKVGYRWLLRAVVI